MKVKEVVDKFNGEFIEKGTGNVFEDLGLPNPEEREQKAILAERIALIIKERGLTQKEAGKLLNIDQAKVSKIICGKLREFSLSTLMDYLMALGQDIEIVVKPHKANSSLGTMSVKVA